MARRCSRGMAAELGTPKPAMTDGNTPRCAILEGGALLETPGAEHRVPWWSFTKTVIAAAALALVRDGKLGLDEAVPGRPFTLRQLLQHRAGLTTYGGEDYLAAVARGDTPWRPVEMLARTQAERLRYTPGDGWAYSNIGYLFVRRRIEDASGEPLGAALDRLVLGPLGIDGTRLAETPADLADVDLIGAPGTAPYHPGWVYHGLLVGPLGAATLLLDRLLTGSLLPPSLLVEMCTPHPLGGALPGRPWAAHGYGLGLMIGHGRDGQALRGHTGVGPGGVIAVYHRAGTAGACAACCAPDAEEGRVETVVFDALVPTGQG
jgi:CubicO group peptidase (beta-lactamase class C family)